jgi:hypothetical protein
MDRVNSILILIVKRLNQEFDLWDKNGLNNYLNKINNASNEELSRMAIDAIDFTIAHNCFASYQPEFKEIKLRLSTTLPSATDNNFTKLIINYLKSRDLDYYLCGGVALDIGTKGTLQREHSDIDILMNEKHLDSLLEELYGYGLEVDDLRLEQIEDTYNEKMLTDKQVHEVRAHIHDKFSVGVFLFTRGKDGHMIKKRYYFTDRPVTVIKDVPKELEELLYHKDPRTSLKTESLESIYQNKFNRGLPKDLGDILLLADHINYDKVKQIRKLNTQKWCVTEIAKESVSNGLPKTS